MTPPQISAVDSSVTVAEWLAEAAAKRPVPGGGAAAALTAATAAAMGEMVLNYSVGRKGLEMSQSEIGAALHELTRARSMLLELMEEDQVAYLQLTAARKARAADPVAFMAAVHSAARVPESIAAAGIAILRLAEGLVGHVNPWLLSDLAVCAELAAAAVRAAGYNVRVNLADIDDVSLRQQLAASVDLMIGQASDLCARTVAACFKSR